MKVIAFDGSPGTETVVEDMLHHAFAMMENSGLETKLVHIGGERIEACSNCGLCKTHYGKCKKLDDAVNSWFSQMLEADGVILASHSRLANMTPEMKAFSDRVTRMAMAPYDAGKPSLLAGKVGGGIVSVPGRFGAYGCSFGLLSLFACNQMVVPFAASMNFAFASPGEDWKQDREGVFLVESFTSRMIQTLKRLHGARK